MNWLDWLVSIGGSKSNLDVAAERIWRQLQSRSVPVSPKELTEGLVLAGLAQLNPMDKQDLRRRLSKLSPRQQRMIVLSADGLTYREIAQRLGIPDQVALRELSAAYHALAWPPVQR